MIDYENLSREQLIRCLERLERERTEQTGNGTDATGSSLPGPRDDERGANEREIGGRDMLTACLEHVAAAAAQPFEPEVALHDILSVVRKLFGADRAWLLYPFDMDAEFLEVRIEATSPEYPGALARGERVRIAALERRFGQRLLDADGPVVDLSLRDRMDSSERFGFYSQMAMIIRPRTGQPWLFGLHQCSHERVWSEEERELFAQTAERLSGALNVTNMRTALRESERRLALALAGASDAVWDWNVPAGNCYIDPEFARMLGEPVEYLPTVETPCPAGVHPHDDREFRCALTRYLESKSSQFEFEFRIQPKHRRWRWILARGKVVERLDDGTARRVVGTYTDITKRKEIERDLERSRARLQKAQEIARLGSWEFSIASNTAVWSDELREILGVERSAAPHPDTLARLIHPEDRDRFRRAMDDVLADAQPYDIEYRIVRPDGGIRHLHSKAEVFLDGQGRPAALVGVAQDVTRYKEQEDRLAQLLIDNRRLMQECLRAQEAERRRLSHELHDELGQSLAVIQMSASFLEDRLKGAAPTMGKAAKDIMEAAGGALDVVRTTARRLRPAALDYLSLADTFRGTLATWCSYKPKVASSFDTTGDIESLPEEFRVILFRILQESLTNIAKHADATSVAVRLDATGNGVTLTVEDNGKGMDVEESSAGFGLLSIKERTHALNGDFQIESESGHGTRLSVRLPISRGR